MLFRGSLSTDSKRDRDILLRGEKLSKIFGGELYKMPFRNMFIDEKDLEIAEIVSNFFSAVKKRWPTAWDERGRGMILNRTNGFRALMRFLRNAYLEIASPGDVPSAKKFYDRVFEQMPLNDSVFSTEEFIPGTSGEARLYRVLRGEEQLV